jgi:hypothetical protein
MATSVATRPPLERFKGWLGRLLGVADATPDREDAIEAVTREVRDALLAARRDGRVWSYALFAAVARGPAVEGGWASPAVLPGRIIVVVVEPVTVDAVGDAMAYLNQRSLP